MLTQEDLGMLKPLKEVVVVALWYDSRHLVLVRQRDDITYKWQTPGTRLAKGESHQQAALRVVLMSVDLQFTEDRLGTISRDLISGDTRYVSFRVRLTAIEFNRIGKFNLSGTREIRIIPSTEIKRYLSRKRDRQLAS